MLFHALKEIDVETLQWDQYDAIILASGFEARSVFILQKIPLIHRSKCIVLGFDDATNFLSRKINDGIYEDAGIKPFVSHTPLDYDELLKTALYRASRDVTGRPIKVFVDYSVMTRVWYAYILTWMKYSGDVSSADVDFAYAHGSYEGRFEDLQIKQTNTISGFEGVSAGSRRTIALYGLGYDRFATLTVHDIIQPDSFFCYIADDPDDDRPAQHVAKENAEIIDLSGTPPILLSLNNLLDVVSELSKIISEAPEVDEIIAVPMGPKTHVLGTLLAGQHLPRLTCMHPLGYRANPVQVQAQGRISCWRVEYRPE